MKNKTFLFSMIITFLSVPNFFVGAVTLSCPGTPCPTGETCIPNPLCAESFEEFINALINFIFIVALSLSPLLIVVGGFYMVTSLGNIERIKTGKKIILYTLIGLLVILLAKGIINFFVEKIGPSS